MSHPATSQLTPERESWFREIQEGLLRWFKDIPVLGADRLREDLGTRELIAALLISRVCLMLADGDRPDQVAGKVAAIQVFARPAPSSEEVLDLVNAVESEFSHSGLVQGIALGGLGLAPWSPESTHMLLTERWASLRGSAIPRPRVERELSELWGIEDSRVIGALASLPVHPLDGYPDIWGTLKAESDTRVGNLGAVVWTKHGGDRPAQRWRDSRPWSPTKVGHLRRLGDDLTRCQAAQRSCANLLRQALLGDEFVPVVERAAEIMQEHLDRIDLAIEGMSAIEYGLLCERDADEHFQDGCLETFQQHLLAPRFLDDFLDLEKDAVHGTWGPLPWWSIAVGGRRERGAAEGLLQRGGAQILIKAASRDSDELVITCGEPGLGPSGVEADIRYDLRNVVEACELLLLARRGKAVVDFVSIAYDEWEDRSVELLGTLALTIDQEPAAVLADIATRALRRRLPGAAGPDYYADGVPALDRILKSARLPQVCRAS